MQSDLSEPETSGAPGATERADAASSRLLRTILVCDLVDSTGLTERLGDHRAAQLIRKHDRLARALLEKHAGQEVDKTDGFLLLFERPVHAVAFALDYQRALKHLSAAEGVILSAHVGIHMGEVVVWENSAADIARGAKPIEVEGLVKPVAARLAQLAQPRQILASDVVHDIAARSGDELGDGHRRARWIAHGRYRLKGLPEPIAVHEVGEPSIAPFHVPPSQDKARRVLPWWRRPLVLAAEAAVLLVAIGVGFWFSVQSPPALAFAARDWVVVGNVQNHTGMAVLDDSLDAAIRVGLAQSRYVNLIPEVQVRDTLKRMERDPDSAVGRDVGTEVAQREDARALILPSVAEVGGRLQMSTEIVDPNTGVTVYSDSASAGRMADLLPATDRVLASVRKHLGESLDAIQKTSAPLQKITTSNLEALKALAKAEQNLGVGKVKDALLLLKEALRLDPNFAMAWFRLSTIQNAFLNDYAAAYASLRAAEAHKDRLSARERLFLQATLAQYEDAQKWVDRWTVVAQLYPDATAAQQNLGLGYMWYLHELDKAAPHFRVIAHSRHPHRGNSWYALALIETERGHDRKAMADLAQGRNIHAFAPHFEDVSPDLAQRRYAAVLARLDGAPPALPASMQAEKQVRYAAVAVDRGHDDLARQFLDKAAADAAKTPSQTQRARILLARAALDLGTAHGSGKQILGTLIADESKRAQASGPALDGSASVNLALAAMLAARNGEPGLARKALDASRAMALDHGYYDRAALWRTADCETRFADAAGQRAACLVKLVDGREYTQTHVALWHAYRDAKDKAKARDQADWLLEHRGQAVTELENQPALIPNLLALRQLHPPH